MSSVRESDIAAVERLIAALQRDGLKGLPKTGGDFERLAEVFNELPDAVREVYGTLRRSGWRPERPRYRLDMDDGQHLIVSVADQYPDALVGQARHWLLIGSTVLPDRRSKWERRTGTWHRRSAWQRARERVWFVSGGLPGLGKRR